jgi:hypothetical protein
VIAPNRSVENQTLSFVLWDKMRKPGFVLIGRMPRPLSRRKKAANELKGSQISKNLRMRGPGFVAVRAQGAPAVERLPPPRGGDQGHELGKKIQLGKKSYNKY